MFYKPLLFFSKLDHKILNDGQFKILAIECTGGGAGIDPELFVSSIYISVATKASLVIFNMFNIYKKKHDF